MPGISSPSPYLLTLRTPQSAFMLGFEAGTEDEAHRFVAAWIEGQSIKATSNVTLTRPDGSVSGLADGSPAA